MTGKTREIITLALELEVAERRAVIAELMASLEDEHTDELHPDWPQQILRRLREVEAGAVKPVPWSKVREGLVVKSHRVS